MNMSDTPNKQPSRFATTHWSLIVSANEGGATEVGGALETLCQTYWLPLYAFARRKTSSVDEAQDLTQAFFAELLEKEFLKSADPNRGRFRSFLLTAFKNFMSKQWEKNRAQKRGGGVSPLSLDFQSADSSISLEPEKGLTAEKIFDQQWVLALLNQIFARLQSEADESGQTDRFNALKGFVVGAPSGETYQSVADELGITVAAAKKAASRLRGRYRDLLREEISHTVSNENEIDDEIRKLFTVFKA